MTGPSTRRFLERPPALPVALVVTKILLGQVLESAEYLPVPNIGFHRHGSHPPGRAVIDRVSVGQLAQPVRVALTGRTASPGLFEVMEVLGRDRTLFRLRQGIDRASQA